MLSFLYLQTERVRGVFAQTMSALETKTVREKNMGAEGGFEAGVMGFKASAKTSRGGKATTEELKTPEQMVADLLAAPPGETFIQHIAIASDWDQVGPGSLVVFDGTFELGVYGATREEVWKQFCTSHAEKIVRYDLHLVGCLEGIDVEIPFRSEWFTGPNAFAFLCRRPSLYLEVLAVAIGAKEPSPAMFQPLAFGHGMKSHASQPRTEA